MALSSELISQFVKVLKDDKKVSKETTAYGTIVYAGKPYVQLDGAPDGVLTPVSTTTNVENGERVTVTIKDHTAIVTGNITSPAARTAEVEDVADQVSEFEIVHAHKVTAENIQAVNAMIENLKAVTAKIHELDADTLKAINADIEELRAKIVEAEKLTVSDLDAISATIDNLEAQYGEFANLEAVNAEITNLRGYTAEFTYLSAIKASIKELDAEKLSAGEAEIKYANIDFANIGEAAIRKLFADSGLIKDLVVGDQTITGELVGVTIKGDYIEGNTIVAEKLVVRGEDGLYYQLNLDGETIEAEQTEYNSLNGSIITAKSITAGKISVDDLVAFDATIGGFQITDRSIHSVGKSEVDNPAQGVYLDREGQFAVGDSDNHIKYFIDANGNYKLNISAESITSEIKASTDPLKETVEGVQKYVRFDSDGITISAGENKMSLKLDNDAISFEKNGIPFGWWDGVNFNTGNIMVNLNERAQFGNFAFVPRSDGSMSFLKVAENSGVFGTMSPIGIMTIYGIYPTLSDTTMLIDDGYGKLSDTTLVIGGT